MLYLSMGVMIIIILLFIVESIYNIKDNNAKNQLVKKSWTSAIQDMCKLTYLWYTATMNLKAKREC